MAAKEAARAGRVVEAPSASTTTNNNPPVSVAVNRDATSPASDMSRTASPEGAPTISPGTHEAIAGEGDDEEADGDADDDESGVMEVAEM